MHHAWHAESMRGGEHLARPPYAGVEYFIWLREWQCHRRMHHYFASCHHTFEEESIPYVPLIILHSSPECGFGEHLAVEQLHVDAFSQQILRQMTPQESRAAGDKPSRIRRIFLHVDILR